MLIIYSMNHIWSNEGSEVKKGNGQERSRSKKTEVKKKEAGIKRKATGKN